MPQGQNQSNVLAELKNQIDPLAKKHAADETDYGFQRLPPGINGGIARLTDAYFAKYKSGDNAGKPYLRMSGVVVKPVYVNVNGQQVKVQGAQTSIMVPLCQTTSKGGNGRPPKVTTLEENLAKVQNELRKVGVDAAALTSADGMERACAALTAQGKKNRGPFFKFSTSERPSLDGKSAPGVWENWYGSKDVPEDFDPNAEPGAGTDDGSGDADAETNNGVATGGFNEFAGGEDVDAVIEEVGNGSQEAVDKLTQMALAAGKTEADVDKANSWTEVGEWIKEHQAGGGGGDDTDAGKAEPVKDEVWTYKPPKAKKPIEVKVTKVDKKARTADLVSLENAKNKWAGIAWDDMEPV